jgi:aldose 1-epimerase
MKTNLTFFTLSLAGLGLATLVGCVSMSPPANTLGTISQAPFGKTLDGTPVEIYTLRNSQGMEARIMTYGGIVQSLKVPDKHGKFDDVVLGYDTLDGYLTNTPYFGALIGRYGNRIGGGKFTLEGKTCTLATNNGPNSLHGGLKGFDKVVWQAKPWVTTDGPSLE